ncbi:MAG: hypothetical protein H7644_01275 [Candidatus Heimdallarchaeota archaeon]|nr:hypothetical protein [Candidatus Heimdallarchaeota archaeon]MCK5142380.1 hypothetical protein [Candidatus Heimdallarchaeota archaeon]
MDILLLSLLKGEYERIISSKIARKTCPNCSTKIEKISVASTNNYICLNCQMFE